MGDLLSKIKENQMSFSKGQRKIAEFIITKYDKAAFMTAAKLGDTVGVSESTVVRFATALGYDGYPKLQKELGELVKTKLTSLQRFEISSDRLSSKDVLTSVLNSDLAKIKSTLENVDNIEFDKAVNLILNAKKIYVLGVRSSSALASFLGFYLNLLFDNIRLVHTTSVSEMFEQIYRVGSGDVVIGISYPRYSRRTVKALEYSKECGANVISITDTEKSPLVEYADTSLFARSDMVSFVDSLVAPLSLINALVVALGMRKKDEITKTLGDLEHIWEEYNVYNKENKE